jgi:AcrR family transcriptional regulator
MPRAKEFDRDTVLDQAIAVFASHGFAGASTEMLLQAMGISRQSLYDTFGDKHALFVQALERYNERSISLLMEAIASGPSGYRGIEAALMAFVGRPAAEALRGCMGVMSTCEFGPTDADIALENSRAHARLVAAFRKAVIRGQQDGGIASALDPQEAAQFLALTLTGLKVAARGGTSAAALRTLVQVALRSLR